MQIDWQKAGLTDVADKGKRGNEWKEGRNGEGESMRGTILSLAGESSSQPVGVLERIQAENRD